MITQALVNQFYLEAADYLARHPHPPMNPYANEEHLLYDLRSGAREVWVIACSGEERLAFKVTLLEELEIAAKLYEQPCALAVRRGLTLDEAIRADQTLKAQADLNVLRASDYAVTWMGDFDLYGAECGIVLGLLLPRPADAPPDVMTQELIDRFGLDENGRINVEVDPDHWIDLNTLLDELADDDRDD